MEIVCGLSIPIVEILTDFICLYASVDKYRLIEKERA